MKRVIAALTMATAAAVAMGQSTTRGAETTRYFEVTLVMRVPASAGRPERVQSLTTDLAVVKDRPGASSGRARMMSQLPVTLQKGPTYLDIGTKLDCNDVRVEGAALAMSVVLETSAVNGTVTTRDKDGHSLEEPLLTQRTLQLQARLPFGRPTMVFAAKNMDPAEAKPLPGGGTTDGGPVCPEMQVEMTARELL